MQRLHITRLVPLPRGLTALEILIVISCTVILLALVMSGIASARHTARTNECRNRMRQIGVAVHNFESAHKGLPPGLTHFYDLLPYVGGENLYDQLQSMDTKDRISHLWQTHGSLPQFVCPSDSFANPVEHHFSYRLNQGTVWGFDEKYFPYNGMVSGYKGSNSIPLQYVRDGQSNTVLYSERLVKMPRLHLSQAAADVRAAQNQKRFWWELSGEYSFGDEQKMLNDCQLDAKKTTFGQPYDFNGISLFSGPPTFYDHIATPNSPGCMSSNRMTVATSEHSGGVNVLLVDGSVKFVSESIDSAVWSAVGTRAGNEPESLNW